MYLVGDYRRTLFTQLLYKKLYRYNFTVIRRKYERYKVELILRTNLYVKRILKFPKKDNKRSKVTTITR